MIYHGLRFVSMRELRGEFVQIIEMSEEHFDIFSALVQKQPHKFLSDFVQI